MNNKTITNLLCSFSYFMIAIVNMLAAIVCKLYEIGGGLVAYYIGWASLFLGIILIPYKSFRNKEEE